MKDRDGSWRHAAALVAALVAAASCSEGGTSDADADAGSDADADADAGADADADADARPDADADGPDADVEADVDVEADSEAEIDPHIVLSFEDVTPGEPVIFEVPAGTTGFHVVVEVVGATWSETIGVESLESPSGEPVLEGYRVVGNLWQSSITYQGIAAASVPQNDLPQAMPVEPGAWTMVIGAPGLPAGTPLRAAVYIQRTVDGEFHGATLDLHLYVPEGLTIADPDRAHEVTVEDAPTDPCVVARVDAFYEALEDIFGISRGEVFYHGLSAEFLTAEDEADVSRLFEQTVEPEDRPGIHIMFQNGVTVMGTEVWGISPGAPGAAVRTGSPISGVALNIDAAFTARADGYTLVHEMGHFVGLFHTMELDGVNADPLGDTAECPTIVEDPWGCPEGANIMFSVFWGASGGVGINATPQQQRVARGSPLFRAGGPPTSTLRAGRRGDPPGPGWPVRRSGRALTPLERQLAIGACGAGTTRFEATAIAARLAAGAARRRDLVRIRDDEDVMPLVRRRAAAVLAALPPGAR